MKIKYGKSDFLVWVEELQEGKWDKQLKPVRPSLAKKPIQNVTDCFKSDSTICASK